MKKEYKKALKESMSSMLKNEDLGFLEYKEKSQYLIPGDIAFVKPISSELLLLLILIPHRSGAEQFSIEIGWSKMGRFPHLGFRPSGHPKEDQSEFSENEFVCRLSELWGEPNKWWTIEDIPTSPKSIRESLKKIEKSDAMVRVEPMVEDAIMHVRKYGLPYFDRLIGASNKV